MRAMIVDDERLIVEHMDRLLSGAGIEVLGGYTNPFEALRSAREMQPDVVFLDIEMPELSGLEIAERLYADDTEIEIIFVTAFDHYALDAFRVNALDYLLKPVLEEDLNRSLERIRKRRHAHAAKDRTAGGNRRLSASLFGKFNVYLDGEPVRWVTAKCAELFAYMLLQGDKEASKWQLFEALWNEKDSEKADINLRSTVSRINKTLRDLNAGIALVSVRNGYRLAVSHVVPVVDAEQLERFVLDDVEVHSDNVIRIEQLVEHCCEPLLQEFSGEWCEPYRVRYRQYALQLGGRLLSYYRDAAAEPLKRLRLAEKLIALDPYNDSLRAAALQLHHRLEGPKRTAAYYEVYAALLQADLGTEPSDALMALYRSLIGAAHADKQQPWT